MGRLLLTVVLALTLSGCIANPAPAPLTGAPSPARPTAQPTSPPTAQDPSASTSEGPREPTTSPEDFARGYFEALNDAMRTGDTDQVHLLTTTSCAGCKRLTTRIEEIYAAGGRIETRGWKVREIDRVATAPRSRPSLELTVTLGPQRVTAAEGRPEESFPGSREAMTMHLVGHSGSWYVDRLELTL